jgi:hypothetical protein
MNSILAGITSHVLRSVHELIPGRIFQSVWLGIAVMSISLFVEIYLHRLWPPNTGFLRTTAESDTWL